MWAVVGLGNPGRRYSGTRHNVGFLFMRKLAKDWKVKLKKRRFLSKTCVVESGRENVLLAMPQTYMNRSGLAVKTIIEEGGVRPDKLVVIFDDLDISLGEIRIRREGRAGTHRGMMSITEEIQTTEFPRIRIGIGPPDPDCDMVRFVLSPFRQEEKPLLEQGLRMARDALNLILSGETEKAMNVYNRKRRGSETPCSSEPVLQ